MCSFVRIRRSAADRSDLAMYGKKKDKENRIDIDECAAKKLSHKLMSVKELRDYLVKREYEKEEIDRVVSQMIDFGYLNDARFAEEFLIYDIGRGRSKKKAFYDLRQKGVSDEDIQKGYDEYLDEYGEPDEHKLAYDEAIKVLHAADMEPHEIPSESLDKMQGRIARRLFTRGFSQSLIYEILAEIR